VVPRTVSGSGHTVTSDGPGKGKPVAAQRREHRQDHDSAHAEEAEGIEVIELDRAEYDRAVLTALDELGVTYRQLESQARKGKFTSLRARKLWLAIGEPRSASG
jgi:hypothetical protein